MIVRRWHIIVPRPPLALGQIAVSSADWIASAVALYVLLPPTAGITFPAFLTLFMLAHIVGNFSQVPGGLGVFETVMLFALSRALPAAELLSALFVFRVVYYIVPLVVAAGLVGTSWNPPPPPPCAAVLRR